VKPNLTFSSLLVVRDRARLSPLTLSLALVACGASSNVGFGGDVGSTGGPSGEPRGAGATTASGAMGSTPGDGGGNGSTLVLGAADAASSNGTDNCSAASQLVYVLSTDNDIYSFDPPTKVFTKVSSLQCNALGLTPNSMAIDRQGNAWVNYIGAPDPFSGVVRSGAIFKVDIATGSCAPTNIPLTGGWYQVGMGYSTASATDQTDTLYVAATGNGSGCGGGQAPSANSPGLAIVDTTAGTLTPVGPFTGALAGQSAELTGTGDGRLFGFFVLSPVQVAQIDKTSGATPNPITMTGVQCPQAWAFSFWGGDFYLYTSPDVVTDSTVTHYTTANGAIDTNYVPDVGFVIVGAGVSTCAPTTSAPK
jgi:hypothetical protein